MPADIITVGFCPQYNSTWRVRGSGGRVWTVQLYADLGASCDCPSYQFAKGDNKGCKHITAVWEHACLWNPQWKDAGPNDYAAHGIEFVEFDSSYRAIPNDPCPGCGGDMIPVRIAV